MVQTVANRRDIGTGLVYPWPKQMLQFTSRFLTRQASCNPCHVGIPAVSSASASRARKLAFTGSVAMICPIDRSGWA